MIHRTAAFRHVALCALLASAGWAHATDAPVQRLALACTQATCASSTAKAQHAAPAATQRAPSAKKAARERAVSVDYERDLWRHQSAS